MLNENQELWEKQLPDAIERLFAGTSKKKKKKKSQEMKFVHYICY